VIYIQLDGGHVGFANGGPNVLS